MEDNLPDECVALRHVVLILSWNKMQADLLRIKGQATSGE